MKTLILTPNKTEMCGMYQLVKDLAKEFNGFVATKQTYLDDKGRRMMLIVKETKETDKLVVRGR